MSFISIQFAIFFAVSVLLYYLLPKKTQPYVLLAASVVFYLFSGLQNALYITVSTAVTFLCALGIGRTNDEFFSKSRELKKSLPPEEFASLSKSASSRKRLFLALALFVDLGILIVLLYLNFILENVFSLFGGGFTALKFIVPLGLSFYTFAAVGYVVDVSRGKYSPERNFAKFALFMTYFPHVTNGPIPRYEKISPLFAQEHPFNPDDFLDGLRLALWGIFKQLVVAASVSPYASSMSAKYSEMGGLQIWIGMIAWGIELYASFSGSIDFIRGISECYGITLAENFRRPYFATDLTDYWNRWHISLSDWLKDYVFYPIALSKRFSRFSKFLKNKCGKFVAKTLPVGLLSLFLFTLVGVWHGANWGEILFGVFNGVVIMISTFLEPVFQKIRKPLGMDRLAVWRVFRAVRTFIIITLTRVISKAPSVSAAMTYYIKMFFAPGAASLSAEIASAGGLKTVLVRMIPVIIGVIALFAVSMVEEKKNDCRAVRSVLSDKHTLRIILEIVLIVCILVFGSYGIGYDSSNFEYPPKGGLQ